MTTFTNESTKETAKENGTENVKLTMAQPLTTTSTTSATPKSDKKKAPGLTFKRLNVSPGAFFLSLLGVALVVLVVVSGWAIVNFTFSVPFSFAVSLVDSLVKVVMARSPF